jgi:sporulation protein YlmC with PRC-barrel domain
MVQVRRCFMNEIPLDARVECTDGPCGKSIALIIDRETRRVTHFAVEDESLRYAPYQRLVPVDQLSETTTTPGLIRLKCTRDELNQMEPFIHTRYVMHESEDYIQYEGGGGLGGAGGWRTYSVAGEASAKIEEEQVPAGEVALHPGTQVHATDGHVGVVEELMVDPDSQRITHVVLRGGHWWGKKEVQIPISAIERGEGDAVYLNLDKKAIGELPVIHR